MSDLTEQEHRVAWQEGFDAGKAEAADRIAALEELLRMVRYYASGMVSDE